MAQRRINRQSLALLTGCRYVCCILRHPIESCLLIDGLLHLAPHMAGGEFHESNALLAVKLRSGLHQSDVSLTHKIFHRNTMPLILPGYGHHELQIRFYQSSQGTLIALMDLPRKLALLFVGEHRAVPYLIQISVQCIVFHLFSFLYTRCKDSKKRAMLQI